MPWSLIIALLLPLLQALLTWLAGMTNATMGVVLKAATPLQVAQLQAVGFRCLAIANQLMVCGVALSEQPILTFKEGSANKAVLTICGIDIDVTIKHAA